MSKKLFISGLVILGSITAATPAAAFAVPGPTTESPIVESSQDSVPQLADTKMTFKNNTSTSYKIKDHYDSDKVYTIEPGKECELKGSKSIDDDLRLSLQVGGETTWYALNANNPFIGSPTIDLFGTTKSYSVNGNYTYTNSKGQQFQGARQGDISGYVQLSLTFTKA